MKNFIKEEFIKNIKSSFLDLVNNNPKFSDTHYTKSINLWGKGNHAKNKSNYLGTKTHIEKLIQTFGEKDFYNDSYLEIGCGEGIDLKYVLQNFNINHVYAVDIGENIEELSKRNDFKDVNFIRCDCLELPFLDDSFKHIYSYGVFHHTKNFYKALLEAKRVLKKNGVLIFYTYKKHNNIFKKMGIHIESILLKIFSKLNYSKTKFFCYLLSPLVLLFFSYPAHILKFFGSKKIYKMFPLWWGTTPENIIYDLTDRLYSPINIRYNVDELKKILKDLNFSEISIVDRRDGLFCRVVKE